MMQSFRQITGGASVFALAALLSSAAAAADFTSQLSTSDEAGVPEGQESAQWLEARGEAMATADGDQHEITLEASNLVPDGLYTVWWVNPGLIGMDMGPAGGVPANEFRADGEGSVEVTFDVPADNDYERMSVAYHADDQTHGEEPGAMGEVTFEHLTAPWPGPAGGDM